MKKHAVQLEKTSQNSTKSPKSASSIRGFPILTSDVDSSRKIKHNRHLKRVSRPIRRAAMTEIVLRRGHGGGTEGIPVPKMETTDPILRIRMQN